MPDEFKDIQRSQIGIGGLKCPCCGPKGSEGRKKLRRFARRKLKQEVDKGCNNMDKYLFVKYSYCYADEFEAEGFFVISEERFETIKKNFKQHFLNHGYHEVYFGTNEFLTFESYDDFMMGMEASNISKHEAERFVELFKPYNMGTFRGCDTEFIWGLCTSLLDLEYDEEDEN